MPVPLTCGHCNHEWSYTGEKAIGAYTNCPTCYYKVRIEPSDG